MSEAQNTPADCIYVARPNEVAAVQWLGDNIDEVRRVFPGFSPEYLRDKGVWGGMWLCRNVSGGPFWTQTKEAFPFKYFRKVDLYGEGGLPKVTEPCPKCKETGKTTRSAFAESGGKVEVPCSLCKGRGKLVKAQEDLVEMIQAAHVTIAQLLRESATDFNSCEDQLAAKDAVIATLRGLLFAVVGDASSTEGRTNRTIRASLVETIRERIAALDKESRRE